MSVILPVVAAALAFLAGRVVIGRREVARLERRVEAHMRLAPRHDESSSDGGSLRRQLDGLERSLASHGWWDVMVTRLERAGVERRPVDVFVLMCTATLVLTVLATTASLLLGLLLLVGVPAGWWLFLGARAERRIRAFEKQLPDLLGALASSLRAGHGFLQSLQAAAHDAPAPTGPELRRALTETRLGRPVDEALAGVVARMPSKDFSYVLTAIAVQRQVGGSLAALFETVNETVRQRQQFADKVRALTATGRASAYALVALPLGLAALLSFVNHSYLTPLFRSPTGRLMLLLGTASLLIGTLVVRRIVTFRA